MKKKVIFVITKSVWGGAGKYVYDLATNLPTDCFDVAVAAGGSGSLFEKLRAAGVRTIHIPELDRDIHIGKDSRSFGTLLRLFLDEQPDIVHLNSPKVGGLGALAARIAGFWLHKKMLIIFTVHGWAFIEDRPLFWRIRIFLASWTSAFLQDKIILINSRDYAIAQRFIPHRKLCLIFNGINETNFLPREEARRFLSKRIQKPIHANTLVIGAIAELTGNKGLDYLIDAVKHKNNTGFKVLIIGDGEERKPLEQQIGNLHLETTIFLLGFVPDAAHYLSGMDIFVLPSTKEGLPYAVMEALTVGLPIIASNVGGIPDLISHNETGILAPPKNPEALAEAIQSLIQNPQQRMALGKRAREVVRTKFSLRAMLEQTQHLYETAD